MRIIVKAKPGSSLNKVVPIEGGYIIYTTRRPIGGQANQAIIKQLAGYLGLSPNRIRIVLGKTSKEKLVEVDSAC